MRYIQGRHKYSGSRSRLERDRTYPTESRSAWEEKNPKFMKEQKIVAFLPAQMLEKALRLQFEQCSQPGDCGRSGEMGGKHQSTTFSKLSILSFAVFLKSHFG